MTDNQTTAPRTCIKWGDPGRGTLKGKRRVVFAYLDDEVVAEIRTEAKRKGVSLSEQLRLVIEWGLAGMEECNQQ